MSPALPHHIPLLYQGDGRVRFLSLRNSGSWICTLGFKSSPPASSKSACFFSMPLSRRSPSRPMNYGSSPCRVTRGLLRQRARVVGALEKRINLSGSLSLDLFLSPSPSLFSSFSCQSVAHGEAIILTPSWPQSWTGGSSSAQNLLPSASCDQSQPATKGLSRW